MLLVVSLVEKDVMWTSPAIINGNITLQKFEVWSNVCRGEIYNSKKSPQMLLSPTRNEEPHIGRLNVGKIAHNEL